MAQMTAINNDYYAITVGFKNMTAEAQERIVELIGILDDTQQKSSFSWIEMPDSGDIGGDEMYEICRTHKVFKELSKLTTKTTPIGKKFGPGLSASMSDLSPENIALMRHVVNAYILGNLFEKQVCGKPADEIVEYSLWDKLAAVGITHNACVSSDVCTSIDVADIKQQFMNVKDADRYAQIMDILECFVGKKVRKTP
jgi:hypothetical protein